MSVTLEIGKYNEQIESAGFQKMEFSDIDEAIANLEFMKMGFNYFKNGESLKVRLEEGSKVHLIDYDAVVPINELRQFGCIGGTGCGSSIAHLCPSNEAHCLLVLESSIDTNCTIVAPLSR